MNKELRIAAVGVGTLGFLHAKNIQSKVSSARITKVLATRIESAKNAAEKLSVDQWTTNPEEIFEDPNVDAVIITTPDKTHAELIKLAVQHGKHIFVEKPITSTLEEAYDVIETIEKNKVICQVGFMRRFDPAYAEAKRRIEQGDIGQPIYFKAVSRDPDSPPEAYIKNSGSTIFHNFTIHDFDIARFLIGSEVSSIRAMGGVLQNDYLKKYNDYDQTLAYLTFESGALSDIETSRNAGYGYDIRAEVIGTEGTIQIGSLRKNDIKILTPDGKNSHHIVPEYQTRFKESFVIEMEHFVESVLNKSTPACTALDALRALEIAEAADKACKMNQEVKIERKNILVRM
ncbi:Gfo/Idh/MocA family oxidoreductase [Ectobacillus funiculus]|uniref:Gfo/Idh/MocA family oxidoreductase n=1 Tax=Ectobacillus funiculus TaxID=137993 RepID=UPI00397BB6CD